jgi:hypothetical protein
VRKKTKKLFPFPDEEGDDESGNDEERDEYRPDSEMEEPVTHPISARFQSELLFVLEGLN